MVGFGFPKETAHIGWIGIWALMPYIIIYGINEIMRNFLITIGHNNVFTIMNFVQLALIFPLGYFFIDYLKWGIVGCGIFRFAVELPNSIVYIVLILKNKDENMFLSLKKGESLKFVLFSKKMWEFTKFYFMCFWGPYLEYMGWEATTIMAGAYHDVDMLTAWTVIQIIMLISSSFGMGYANACRN